MFKTLRTIRFYLMLFFVNEIVSNCPIFFIRKFVYRLILGKFDTDSSILMHVELRAPRNILIGKRCVVNRYSILDGRGAKILIGDDVDIGPGTYIWTLEHDPDSNEHNTRSGDVKIEDHVWIGSGVIILPGVTIKRGAVIASGAVVTKNIDELVVAGGVPAKPIKVRNNNLSYKIKFKSYFR